MKQMQIRTISALFSKNIWPNQNNSLSLQSLKRIMNHKKKKTMKTEEIKELFSKFESIVCDYNGVECWSARELYKLLGYSQWRNFLPSVEKAREACRNAGEDVLHHFADARKMVDIGSGSQRPIENFLLTRYACYLVAQNGDSRKPEIAFAQNYFAAQTRRAELIEQRLLD